VEHLPVIPRPTVTTDLPLALEHLEEIVARLSGRRPAVFLDYDGTLTPIVPRPEMAVLSPPAREAIEALAGRCFVAVVSGRDRRDVEKLVGLEGIAYAGSHGFDIAAPGGDEFLFERGVEFLPDLDAAEVELLRRLGSLEGVQVERKRFAIAVHYRRAAADVVPAVARAVEEVQAGHGRLRRTGGKMIFELRPALDWDKGKAVAWLLERFSLKASEALPIYIGDDETDEDAFRALQPRGLGIVVRDEGRPTAAAYALEDCRQVELFLRALAGRLSAPRGGGSGSA